MDYSTKPRNELIMLCKEKSIKGYSNKKKEEIITLLLNVPTENTKTAVKEVKEKKSATDKTEPLEKICRLNYIGSKFQLLDWITSHIKEKTTWSTFEGKTIADIFGGTGVVSHHFRENKATVISNDAELYSSIITHAFTRSIYTEKCKEIISTLQKDLDENVYSKDPETTGYITKHYSPYDANERKFFTVDNAKRIDYIRSKLEELKDSLTNDEYNFILASILLSADTVSNVPAVYGCFLKNFKAKALKSLTLQPIHKMTTEPTDASKTYNSDVLHMDFLKSFEADVAYLDPPYNERQYSKNYFPLNMIAKTPDQLRSEDPLKGKTGIPSDCFISPFCKKGEVEKAFDLLFRELNAQWIFLSYNSESIVSKEKMLNMMNKYGSASVIECDYKRFKSFEYNKDVSIKEYLFCLKKN
jgi:adenine-specific DNA-methyltransferase